eukprot:TRINITY_DN13594_c0_g1_i2.p1 TRINITY_DN13594_c0_g1~~TRINITY_DN13594_c0_g1_i2.p1  ORF type:complete len:110 (+),score=30.71 TRINITY_DN13594_c0_g1_i2:237-566(+)
MVFTAMACTAKLMLHCVHLLASMQSSSVEAQSTKSHDADGDVAAASSPPVFIMSGADDDGDVADEDWGAEFNLTNSGCQVFALAADGDDSDDDNVSTAASSGSNVDEEQ